MTTLLHNNLSTTSMLSFFFLLLIAASTVGAMDPMRWDFPAFETNVISVVLCKLTKDEGQFGSMNNDEIEMSEIKFYYAVEIASTSLLTDEEIVNGIESSVITDVVLPNIFPKACTSPAVDNNDGRKNRSLSLRGGGGSSKIIDIRRRLNVASGLSTEPADKVITEAPCTTSNPDNSCIVVESGFTLYSVPPSPEEGEEDPLASNSIMEKIEETTKNAIQSALQSGYFNNDDIVGISMKSAEEIEDVETNYEVIDDPNLGFDVNANNVVNTKGTSPGGGNDTLIYSIVAVAAALVIVFGSAFFIKKKRNNAANEQQQSRGLVVSSKYISKDLESQAVVVKGEEEEPKEHVVLFKAASSKGDSEDERSVGSASLESASKASASVIKRLGGGQVVISADDDNNDSVSVVSSRASAVKRLGGGQVIDNKDKDKDASSVGSGGSRASVVRRLGGGIVDNRDSVSVASSGSRASMVKRLGGGLVDSKDAVSVSNASISMKKLVAGQVVIKEEDEEDESSSSDDNDEESSSNNAASTSDNRSLTSAASIVRRMGGGLMGQFLPTTAMPKHDEEEADKS